LRQAAAAKRQRLAKNGDVTPVKFQPVSFKGNKKHRVNGMKIAPLVTNSINWQFFGVYEF